MAVCVTDCVSSLSVCLWGTCLVSSLVESANGRVAAVSSSLRKDRGSPDIGLLSMVVAGQEWSQAVAAAGGSHTLHFFQQSWYDKLCFFLPEAPLQSVALACYLGG